MQSRSPRYPAFLNCPISAAKPNLQLSPKRMLKNDKPKEMFSGTAGFLLPCPKNCLYDHPRAPLKIVGKSTLLHV